jgi:hypothetical protein
MLPKASDPESAQVIVCHSPKGDAPVQAAVLMHSLLMAHRLSVRTKLQ